MKPQDVVVFEEKLSGFATWKWVFFRACEIDALALGDGFFQGFWLVKITCGCPVLMQSECCRIDFLVLAVGIYIGCPYIVRRKIIKE